MKLTQDDVTKMFKEAILESVAETRDFARAELEQWLSEMVPQAVVYALAAAGGDRRSKENLDTLTAIAKAKAAKILIRAESATVDRLTTALAAVTKVAGSMLIGLI